MKHSRMKNWEFSSQTYGSCLKNSMHFKKNLDASEREQQNFLAWLLSGAVLCFRILFFSCYFHLNIVCTRRLRRRVKFIGVWNVAKSRLWLWRRVYVCSRNRELGLPPPQKFHHIRQHARMKQTIKCAAKLCASLWKAHCKFQSRHILSLNIIIVATPLIISHKFQFSAVCGSSARMFRLEVTTVHFSLAACNQTFFQRASSARIKLKFLILCFRAFARPRQQTLVE